jgi:16S rRNA processing protein RimM
MSVSEALDCRRAEDRRNGELIVVGRVRGVYGVRGWIKVYSYTRPKTNILDYSPWFLAGSGGWIERQVVDVRRYGDGLLAQLKGYQDRAQARGSIGQQIAVYRSQLPELAAGEYYWADLIGMRVINQEGNELGTVAGLIETGAHDVLVVQGERERLIPFISGVYIYSVDLVTRCIAVDWDPDA